MATIQIADKPTLDAVKERVDSIKNVMDKDTYPNVSMVSGSKVSVTGKGKIAIINGSNNDCTISNFTLDGISTSFPTIGGKAILPLSFDKSISFNTTQLVFCIIQLAD